MKVIELAYGPAPAVATGDVALPDAVADLEGLGWREMQILAGRLVAEMPAETTMVAEPVSVVATVESGDSAAGR